MGGAVPEDTTKLTGLPMATLMPATGFWLMTLPAGTVALVAWVMVPTVRPTPWIAAMAAAWVEPTTLVDRNVGGRGRPRGHHEADRAARIGHVDAGHRGLADHAPQWYGIAGGLGDGTHGQVSRQESCLGVGWVISTTFGHVHRRRAVCGDDKGSPTSPWPRRPRLWGSG